MIKRICSNCGKSFVISDSETDFLKAKNLELPKRCSDCREEKRKREERSRKNVFVRLSEKIQTRVTNLTKVNKSFKYGFKNNEELKEHFLKHGRECNCRTVKKYLKTANYIIKNKKSLKKYEKEDGDAVYFNKKLGGIVFV